MYFFCEKKIIIPVCRDAFIRRSGIRLALLFRVLTKETFLVRLHRGGIRIMREKRQNKSRKVSSNTCIDSGALKFTSRWKEGKLVPLISSPSFVRLYRRLPYTMVVYRKKNSPPLWGCLFAWRSANERGIWNKAVPKNVSRRHDVNCKTRSSHVINSQEIIKYKGAVCKELRRTSGAYSPRSFQAIFPPREFGSLPISRST